MPFEVYPILPMHRGNVAFRQRDNFPARTSEIIAEEIKQHYENVAAKGGQIIASHSVNYSNEGIGESGDYTFLVAEFPEA